MYKLPKLNRNYIVVTQLGLLISGLVIVEYYFFTIALLFLLLALLIKAPNLFNPIDKNAIVQYFLYSSLVGLCVLAINKLMGGNLILIFFIAVPMLIFKEIQFYKRAWKQQKMGSK